MSDTHSITDGLVFPMQLTVGKSPVCERESFVVAIKESGVVLGKNIHVCFMMYEIVKSLLLLFLPES